MPWPFSRSPKQMTELEQSIANGVSQVAAGKQSGDEEARRSMAEDYLLLKDTKLDGIVMGMSQYKYVDANGDLGEKGQEYTGVHPKNLALAISQSSLIRTGWTTEKQARIMQLENASLYLRREMLMSEEEYEEGGELVLDAMRKVDDMNVLCSVNGRQSKLVKSRPHSIEVSVGQSTNGKGNPQ